MKPYSLVMVLYFWMPLFIIGMGIYVVKLKIESDLDYCTRHSIKTTAINCVIMKKDMD